MGQSEQHVARPTRLARRRAGLIGLGMLALTVPAMALTAGTAAAEEKKETQTVPLQGATSADVDLDMDFGDLTIGVLPTGGSDLLQANFAYDDGEWQPSIAYAVENGTGDLEVNQPGDFGNLDFNDLDDLFQNDGNSWEVQLAPDVPMDLTVDLDSGSGQLNLGGLNLRTLDVEMNAGELTVDLSGGTFEQDLDASIDNEAGPVKLIVPQGVGVRINTDTGIGGTDASGFTRDGDAYVNEAYGESPVTLRFDVDTSVGEVELEVAD